MYCKKIRNFLSAFLIFMALVVNSFADERVKEFALEAPFAGASLARFKSFSESNRTDSSQGWSGILLSSDGSEIFRTQPCETEGGEPTVIGASVVGGDDSYFEFACSWEVLHRGLGIVGADIKSFVYERKVDGEIVLIKKLSSLVSGYEGTLEGGGRSFFWYSSNELRIEKIRELRADRARDSLRLALEIVSIRHKASDFAAIKSYLSLDRIAQMLLDDPLTKNNVNYYNSFYAILDQIGEHESASALMKKIEFLNTE